MKVYVGIREKDGTLNVTVNGQPLNPRLDLWNHSPTGFECGYGGSGPAQLALALLADHLNNDEEALALHQSFKHEFVASLSPTGWTLTSKQIEWTLQLLRDTNSQSADTIDIDQLGL